MQAERAHEHTHSPTPQPGVAGCSQNLSPNTHTHTAQPSQEWLGASGARTRAHTQPNTPARSGGVQPKPEPKHTHPHRASVPGVAGCKLSTHTAQRPIQEWRGAARNPSPNTHTHTAHPCQEWLGASGARTHPNTPATSGGAQRKPAPKRTHPHRATVPGVAGCNRSAHTSTHTAQHPSQEWQGAAETRAQTHTPTPRTRARSGWVQAEHAHGPTAQRGVAGCSPKPEPKHTHPHRTPVPGVAGCKRSAHTSTHTAQHPSQEWRGAAETRAQTHTPTPRTRARSGMVPAEHAHSQTAQPGVAGPSPKPEPKHTHPHRAPVPGVAGCKRSTHTAQQPSQEWRGAAETRAQTPTPTPRTRARSGGVQAEHTHSPTPQPGVAGRG